MNVMPIVRTGSWLYAGTVKSAVQIERREVHYGTGDYENPAGIREDREEPCYAVWYESPPGVVNSAHSRKP